MVKVYVGNANDPKKVIADENKTIRKIYEENGLSIPYGAIVTNGAHRLGDADIDKTLKELGIGNEAIVTVTQKLAGAR